MYFTDDASPWARRRDQRVIDALGSRGRPMPGGFVVDDPSTVLTRQGRPYTVFSPFARSWLQQPRRDVVAATDAATLLLLGAQIHLDADGQRHGRRSGEARPSDGPDGDRPSWEGIDRAEVHQATGMILAQLDIPAADAFVRLRAHAFAHQRPLAEVAADVVMRRLVFTDDTE